MNADMMTGYDIRGTAETGLTIEYAWNVGKAVADWLPTAGHVIVTYRPEQHAVANAIIEGLRLQGRSVVDGGAADQAAVEKYIQTLGLSGGIAIRTDDEIAVTTIQLLDETGRRIEGEATFTEINELIEGGNFVPAAIKGEVSAVA